MKEECKEIIKKEVARLVEYLQENGEVSIVIMVDHHHSVEGSSECMWMREQVFSYLCETTDGKIQVDDSEHTQTLCNGDTGRDTLIARVKLTPTS